MLQATTINPENNTLMIGFDWTTHFDTESKSTVQAYIQLDQLVGLYKHIESSRKTLQYIQFHKSLPKFKNIELLKKQIKQMADIRQALRANGQLSSIYH